jgi:hypothetical protein
MGSVIHGRSSSIKNLDLKWHGRELEATSRHRVSSFDNKASLEVSLELKIEDHTFRGWVLKSLGHNAGVKDADIETAEAELIEKALIKLEDDINNAASGHLLKCRKEDAEQEIAFQKECVITEERKRDVGKWLKTMMDKE